MKFCDVLKIVDTLANNFQEEQIEDMIFEIVDFKEVTTSVPAIFLQPKTSVNWVQYMTQYGKTIFLCNGAKGLQDLANTIVDNTLPVQKQTLESLVEPLIKYLNENHYQNTSIVITPTQAKMIETILHI